VIRNRRLRDSFSTMKKALLIVVSLAVVAMLWLGAGHTTSARHDATRPVTRGTTDSTEVLRVQSVQVDTFEIDMHDGGVWGQPQSESDGS